MKVEEFLFKRYRGDKKAKFISEMTSYELNSVPFDVFVRIIKEVGVKWKHSNNRDMYLEKSVSNDWNAKVKSLFYGKKKTLYVEAYMQGLDTDADVSCEFNKFFRKDGDQFEFTETYGNGRSSIQYASFDKDCKTRIIRVILLTYVHDKYSTDVSEYLKKC